MIPPIVLWILHAEDRELRHIPKVTRLDVFDGASNDFHAEGLFSTEIFGQVGSDARDQLFGKIDLGVNVYHPKIYREITSLKELYKDIIEGRKTAIFDNNIKDFVPNISEDAGTGYAFFVKHFKNVVLKPSNSLARANRIAFLAKWKSRWMMKNLVAMPAGLRDVEIEDGRVTKNEINDFYYKILANANSVTTTDDMESPAYDTVRRVIQASINQLFEYLEGIVGGGDGFFKDKWASRRVHEGTRNVMTAMNTGGLDLDSPNVPSYDSTLFGLHQTATGLAPKVIHWLKTGICSKLFDTLDTQVPLINKKTLETEYVTLSPASRALWQTDSGLRKIIGSLMNVKARQRPVMIDDRYLALVYLGEGTFKVFNSIDELPPNLDKKDCHPITLIELIYISGYSQWGKHFAIVNRYPCTGDDSTYPSRYYVRTTATGEMRHELDAMWQPILDDEHLAVEYPIYGMTSYHDSQSAHPSKLNALGADHDGDMSSGTSTLLVDTLSEIEQYLGAREAWISPDGRARASSAYDTVNYVVRNLTGRFNHVSQTTKTELIEAKRVLGK